MSDLTRKKRPRKNNPVRFAMAMATLLGMLCAIRAVPADESSGPASRIDYLTLANGAIPVQVRGDGAALGASFTQAIRIVDGNPAGFVINAKPGPESLSTAFTYELPSLTTFDRFAVPNVLETPSPGTTFVRDVVIAGSSTSADAGFVTLARATLRIHETRGQLTEIKPDVQVPVRWLRLEVSGGTGVMQPASFFEFSELIGNGHQDAPGLLDRFSGAWKGRGVKVALEQADAVVAGCYDIDGTLKGTVSGNLLSALGEARSTGVKSAFILTVRADGGLFGVRSTNGAPFVMYTGDSVDAGGGPSCKEPAQPALGCGAVIHGFRFDYDSATLRESAQPVLNALFEGLRDDPAQMIVIEGHTSSEGSDAYNLDLSTRRAKAVVEALVAKGIAANRLSSSGIGEARPIATNDDENGRSLNRRVEVQCK